MKRIFQTERLIVREFNIDDAAFALELLNTPGWLEFIGNRKVHSVEDAQSYLQRSAIRSYEVNGFGLWLMEVKDTGAAAGMCGLIRREGLEDIDIGFALLPHYEGKGYAYEAASATMKHAKELGIDRIVAITSKHNSRSIGLLEKIGLKFEKMITLPNDDEELMLFGTSAILRKTSPGPG